MPQLEQGFLHPQAWSETGKPQRRQVSVEAGKRGGKEVDIEVAFPRSWLARSSDGADFPASPLPRFLPNPIRSREERIGEPLDANAGIGAMATMDHRAVR